MSDDDALDFVLRKCAHMAVFAMLAILVVRAVARGANWTPASIAVGWLLTLALAISDEWHQTFVHGRVGHASDVLIDMAGATLGVTTGVLVHRRRARRTPPRSEPLQ